MAALVVGIATVGVVAGCGTTVDGAAQTAGPTVPRGDRNVVWNPCTQLSDAALRATRVDPATRSVVSDAPTGATSARLCNWTSTEGPYLVGVAATVYTQDEARQNTNLTVVREARIGPRPGFVHYDPSDDTKILCYVNIPSPEGSYEISVGWRTSERAKMKEAPPCGLAVVHAEDLEPYLPK
ncbi:DUF3558 domain-containing protein [Nocardia bovistercoris]|uniref:DUF3558 domain-containing protein n=1 Tax=Nocardia bovistercoris TaxID=2785916 RepID=A0A931N376_9NOCA|nr:DUF3558 domain-containing protein [Nocardia bovistercoris]MBH0776841.1 DUF3558 domain-containing protein [Nocardia bovistercoris]